MTAEFPAFVYKIVDAAPPEILPHALPLSELDVRDGFIHLSDAGQVTNIADLYFGNASTLWFLKISTAVVEKEGFVLKWANGLPGCVHLYGRQAGEQARLGEGIVVGVRSFTRSDELSWLDAVEGQDEAHWTE